MIQGWWARLWKATETKRAQWFLSFLLFNGWTPVCKSAFERFCLFSLPPPLLSDLLSLLLHWRGQASTFSSWPSLPSLPSAQHRNINSTTQPFAFSSGYSGNTHVPLQLEQCSADCTLTISCCTFVQRKCAAEDFFASTVHSWVTSSTESLHSLQLRRPWLPRCK